MPRARRRGSATETASGCRRAPTPRLSKAAGSATLVKLPAAPQLSIGPWAAAQRVPRALCGQEPGVSGHRRPGLWAVARQQDGPFSPRCHAEGSSGKPAGPEAMKAPSSFRFWKLKRKRSVRSRAASIWCSSFACPPGRPKSRRRRHSSWLALLVRKMLPRSWGAKPGGSKEVELAALEAARSSTRGSGGAPTGSASAPGRAKPPRAAERRVLIRGSWC